MRIQGLQKLTLLDFPGRLACTVFTAGCNFRCPFCHNASLVTHIDVDNDIPPGEVLDFLKRRKGVLEGVCISGGEPLLQPDLDQFIQQVKSLGFLVKLDTNGSNADRLKQLVRDQLIDYVAMDVKNTPDKYGETIGLAGDCRDYLQNVCSSVDYLLSGAVPYEFRTTVVREFHKREDITAIGQWIAGAEQYYLQSFLDSGDLIKTGCRAYTKEIMVQALELVREYVPNAKLRGIE